MNLSRRNFLSSVSALTLTSMMGPSSRAFAGEGDRGGERAALNLWYLTTAKDYPFLNFIKVGTQLRPSSWVDPSPTPYPALMGADGYLKSEGERHLNFGNIYIPVFAGYWVLKWTGAASLRLAARGPNRSDPPFCTDYAPAQHFSSRNATGVTISGGAPGVETRVTFKISSSVYRLIFQSKSAFSNLVLCQGDPKGVSRTENLPGTEEELLSRGEIFRPDFLSTLRALNPGTLRFIQWSNAEYSLNSSFEFENTESTVTWGTMRQDPRLWCGDATVSGRPGADRYSVTPPPSYPGGFPKTKTHGAMIQCRFPGANVTDDATINPGGAWGDVLLASPVSPGTGIKAGYIKDYSLATLTYDATLDRFFFKRNFPGLGSSVPLAVQVALCNKLGCNFWWNIQYLYTDASIAKAIDYIARNLKPGLKCIVEYANECWLGSYYVTAYAKEAAHKLWGLNNQYSTFYAHKLMQIFAPDGPIVPTWTAHRPRNELICMMGCWVADYSAGGVQNRWEGALLPKPPAYPNRPIDLCDAACAAFYTWGAQLTHFGGGRPSYTYVPASARQDLWNAADDYASGDVGRARAALQWVDSDYRAGTCNGITPTGTLSYFNGVMDKWNTHCTNYGLTPAKGKGFWWYEGGYQAAPPSVDQCRKLGISEDYSVKVRNLLTGYKTSDLFRASIGALFDQFMARSNSVAPSWYMFVGNGISNPFSLFQNDLYSTPWASFRAVADFNKRGR